MNQGLADLLVFSSLCLSFIVGIASYIRIKRKHYNLSSRLGKVEWDFSKSWATNVTLFGSLLCTILGSQFGGGQLLGYAGLSLFFGTLIIFAPLLYNTTVRPYTRNTNISTPDAQESNTPDQVIEHHGQVWAFLICSILTLWAIFGQLETILSLLSGPSLQSSFSPLVQLLFSSLVLLALLLVIYYAWKTIFETICEQIENGPAKHFVI